MIVKLTQKCWDKLARIMREKFTDDDSLSITSHHFSIYLDLDIPSFSHEQLKGLVIQLKELGHTAVFYFNYSSDLVFHRWVQANEQLLQAHADMFVNLTKLPTEPVWHAISHAYSNYINQPVRAEIFKELLAADISQLADASELSIVEAQKAILTQLINYIYITVTIADNVAVEKSNVLLYSGTLPAIIRQIIFGDHLNQILLILNRQCPTIMHLKSEFETVMVEEQVGAVSLQRSNDRPLSPAAQMADAVMKRVIVTLLETGASLKDVHNLSVSFQNRSKTSPSSSPPKHTSSFGVFHAASSGNDTSSNDFSRASESFSSPTSAVSSIQSAPASLQSSPEKHATREGRKTPTSGRVAPAALFPPSPPNDDNDDDDSDKKKVKKMRASVDADSSQHEDSSDDITVELSTATRLLRATSSSGNY